MRPKKYRFPNVRKLFLPDPGKIIFDVDLTGADAAVAAKECGGQYLADIKAGRKINVDILQYSYPEVYTKWVAAPKETKDVVREPAYTKCKNMHYGSVYVGSPGGIGAAAAIPVHIVARFQPWFFGKYPEIKRWHSKVEYLLMTERSVSNAFGYRVHYFDRIQGLLPEAVNWICQSTVAIVCQRGSLIIAREFPEVDLLLQVHDSLVGQVDLALAPTVLPRLRERLNSILIPYDEPLTIPWGMKASRHSWGDCQEINWETMEIAA